MMVMVMVVLVVLAVGSSMENSELPCAPGSAM